MNKIISLINKYDKLSHFIAGLILSATIQIPLVDTEMSFMFSNGIFGAKEVYDEYKTNKTGFSLEDYFAGFSGWCFGIFLQQFIYNIV